jgi:probable biosynthetic protein (TIGR04098 family)
MLIEDVELTLGLVGLGNLSETAVLGLFATAQAHALTAGTDHTLRDVTDAQGAPLYPAYMWLHLRVPPARRLDTVRLWDRVSIGVDVKRYGGMILESTYALGTRDELVAGRDAWNLDAMPSMRAASVWVVDGRAGEPQASAPKEGSVATLPTIRHAPDALGRARDIRASGSFGREPRRWQTTTPIRYPVQLGRDVAPGHNLIFTSYVEIMQVAANTLLGEVAWPAVPDALLASRSLIEREVFFLTHTGPGQSVLVDVRADIVRCEPDFHGTAGNLISAGILDVVCELYEAGSYTLLAVGRARELFALTRGRSLLSDLARFLPPH